jgi:hypothetical protein
MSDLRLLAVVRDSNAAVKFRHLARYNPDCLFDCITVRDEATTQLYDWSRHTHHLSVKDMWFTDFPQKTDLLPDLPHLSYERAIPRLHLPLVSTFMHYTPALPDLCEVLGGMLTMWCREKYDAVVLWGEKCWYNEVAKEWAQTWSEHGPLPIVYVERAAVPGMFTADGTGLSAGQSDLELYRDVRVTPDRLARWLSSVTLTGIEQQRPTTPAEVRERLPLGRNIFVPLQVPFDTNMVFRTGGKAETNSELLDWVAKHYAGQRVVVKRHPSDGFTDQGRLEARCAELGFELVDFAIHPLMEQVAEVVTINSQTAVEAWMHGVKVVFLGEPAFALEGMTGAEMLQVLRWGYYVEPGGFGERVRQIIERSGEKR